MGWLSKLFDRPEPAVRVAEPPSAPPHQWTIPDRMPIYVPPPPPIVVDPAWVRYMPTLRPEGFMRVVGESHRQDALRRALAGVGLDRLVTAQLARDRGNPHHGGAVAVYVGGDHVGYLSRDDLGYEGQALYKALARLAEQGVPATCWAQLTGGTPDKPSVGIYLFTNGMDQPDRPYPFPLTIPPGGFATVRGTKQHQELLARVLGRQQEALVGSGWRLPTWIRPVRRLVARC